MKSVKPVASVIGDRNAWTRGRRLGPISLVLAGALILSGCGATSPGAAITVGGTTVSETTLQEQTAHVLAENSADKDATALEISATNRAQATQAIRHVLIGQAAAARGVAVTDSQVNTVLNQVGAAAIASQLQVPIADVSTAVRDSLNLAAMVNKLPAAGQQVTDVSVTVDGVTASSRDDAVALRTLYAADPAAMDKAAADSKQAPTNLDLITRSDLASAGIFAAGVGQVVIYQAPTGILVYRIVSRKTEQASLSLSSFANLTTASSQNDLAALLLAPYAAQDGVKVNPRYGVWDPISVQVVPGNNGQ